MLALIADDQYAQAESHLPGHQVQKTYKYNFLSLLILILLLWLKDELYSIQGSRNVLNGYLNYYALS